MGLKVIIPRKSTPRDLSRRGPDAPSVAVPSRKHAGQLQPRARRWARVTLFIVAFGLPAVWTSLTPPFTPPYAAEMRTRRRLHTDLKVIRAFIQEFKKTPLDLGQLRSYAAAKHLPFRAYDALGERLDYVRLDDRHYLLRSFGQDQEQNRITGERDYGVMLWGPAPQSGPTYVFPTQPTAKTFPVILLMGADSPDHKWLARLFVDPAYKTRQLVVRSRERLSTVMLAGHDHIDEFLWLPDGHRIVFVASGSEKQRDGLYLWDLEQDTLVNLLEVASSKLSASAGQSPKKLWLALAGVTFPGPKLFAFVTPRHEGGLDARVFFSFEHLIGFEIQAHDQAKEVPREDLQLATIESPLNLPPFQTGFLVRRGGGLLTQALYSALPLRGEAEDVLLAWQKFSEKSGDTPLFSYSLLMLAAIYGAASERLQSKDALSATSLRSFGTEIARALLNYPLAPSYLRGLALYTYESLMEGRSVPLRIPELTANGAKLETPPTRPPSP